MRNTGGGSAEAFIELDDLASAYCQKPGDVGWNEHLGPAYKLLMGPDRSLVHAVEIAAISLVAVALAFCIGYWGTENLLLLWTSGAAVTAFGALLLWHQRPSPRPRQLVAQSGDQATYVSLFLRFHEHLVNGAIVAYQRPRPGGTGEYRRVNVGFWRASYGCLGMLGGVSRWYGVERVEQPLYLRRSSVETDPIACEFWLSEAAANPRCLSDWPGEKLDALEGLLGQLLGPNKSVSNAFVILRMFQEEMSEKRVRKNAIAAVAKRLKPKTEGPNGQTSTNIINGQNDCFNKQLKNAVKVLGAAR